MLFTEQFPHHRAAEIARAVQRGARFIEAMFLGESYANDKLNLKMIILFSFPTSKSLIFLWHEVPAVSIFGGVKVIPYPSRQRNDGSWYGCWGNCFTYGCWFGVEGKNQQQKNSSMIYLLTLQSGSFLK